MDTRRLQLLLSGLKVCGEISLEMAKDGEFAVRMRRVVHRDMSPHKSMKSNRAARMACER